MLFEELLSRFLSWPWWERVGVVAGAILAVLGVIKIVRELTARTPRTADDARRVMRHLLETGPAKRPFSAYRKRLRSLPPETIRAMLLELGAVDSTHRYTRAEMWGLKRRA